MSSCITPFPVAGTDPSDSNWHIVIACEYFCIFVVGLVELLIFGKKDNSKRKLWPFRPLLFIMVMTDGLFRTLHFAAFAAFLQGHNVPVWLFFDVFNYAGFLLDFFCKNFIAMFFLECALELDRGNPLHPRRIKLLRRSVFTFLLVAAIISLALRLRVDLDSFANKDYVYLCYCQSSLLFFSGTGYIMTYLCYLRALRSLRIRDSNKITWGIRVGIVFALLILSFYLRGILSVALSNQEVSDRFNASGHQGWDDFVVFTFVDVLPLCIILVLAASVIRESTFVNSSLSESVSEPLKAGSSFFDDSSEDFSPIVAAQQPQPTRGTV